MRSNLLALRVAGSSFTSGFCCKLNAAFAIAQIMPSGESPKIALVILFAGECEKNLIMCLTLSILYEICLILICSSDWKNILFGDDDRGLLYTAFYRNTP